MKQKPGHSTVILLVTRLFADSQQKKREISRRNTKNRLVWSEQCFHCVVKSKVGEVLDDRVDLMVSKVPREKAFFHYIVPEQSLRYESQSLQAGVREKNSLNPQAQDGTLRTHAVA